MNAYFLQNTSIELKTLVLCISFIDLSIQRNIEQTPPPDTATALSATGTPSQL
jgi:hypothetical protein